MPNPEQAEPPIRHVRREVDEEGQSSWEVIPERTLKEQLAYLEAIQKRGFGYASMEIITLRKKIDAEKD